MDDVLSFSTLSGSSAFGSRRGDAPRRTSQSGSQGSKSDGDLSLTVNPQSISHNSGG